MPSLVANTWIVAKNKNKITEHQVPIRLQHSYLRLVPL
jgi:hypothetical protein